MERVRKTYILHLLLSVAVVLLSACINDDDDGEVSVSLVNVGDRIPDFSLSDADGRTVSSSSLSGRIFVLNFFDTGCPDCQRELQVLQRLYDQYGERVPILNVPRSQTKDELLAYWRQAGLSMPFYLPADKELYYRFAKKTIPRTYVLDGSGMVLAAYDDSPIADYDTLDALLQQTLGTVAAARDSVCLSLKLRVSKTPRGSTVDEYYFHNEYTVSRLEVWFFDAFTKTFVDKAMVTDLTKAETLYDEQYDVTYLFERVRLKVGKYDIFAVANYQNFPDVVASEYDFLNMVDSISYEDGVEANIPDSGPVMTSRATTLLNVNLIPWVNKNYMLTIEMERVMAKLQIGVKQNAFQLKYNQRKYADINITNYKLVNMNRCYYLFQHKDSLVELGPQPEFTLSGNFGDYHDKGEQYVVDPYFYQKTGNPSDAALFGKYYKSWLGDFTTEGFASIPSADNYGYAYVLENTSFKTSQKNGYSPGIVFKAAVNPVFVYLYDSSQRVLREEYRPEYWPKTIYLYNYQFYGSIQAVNVASGLMLDELEHYTDAQLKQYGIKQCMFNMGVYETYYTYWIRHRNSPTDWMGPMQYGIVRNNFYQLIITGVSGLGNSSIVPDVLRDNYPNSYTDVLVESNFN